MPAPYAYVGPDQIRQRCAAAPAGTPIHSLGDLLTWLRCHSAHTATFVVDGTGVLRVANRASEHVACAGGEPVLSAGEMFFEVVGDTAGVSEVSNQSTGYCPEPQSWPAVAAALDRAGVAHPGRFTSEMVFRRCEKCGQRNLVKDGWFVCAVCGADLPAEWNFGASGVA